MFTIGYLLEACAKVLDVVLNIYLWIVVARAILSWVNPDPFNPIVRFIHSVTEPVLGRIRSMLPIHFGGIDFSPIVVFLAIIFLQNFVVNTLHRLAFTFLR
ncbi:YggT family protein [Desulfatirhabdium butyrativorans]|jgi:YggT family protein|uniref:YggT family protein n=1 Tax=Desulfatirhabdium butyrativorans TaxID=340467 RepID=UPI0004834F0E|nr:YggT family protein [Desulfatirhabdium butyrativorans]